jgi:anti-sigma factor RsiW
MNERDRSEHPDDAVLAGYLDGKLDVGRRDQVREHLAGCDHCRRTLTDVSRVLGSRRRSRRIRGGTAVAALAASIVLFVIRGPEPARPAEILRGPAEGTALAVHMARLPQADSAGMLVWGSAGSDARYRASVQDASGVELWAETTSDTLAALPASLEIQMDRPHFWVVDALLPDGSSRTTGPVRMN